MFSSSLSIEDSGGIARTERYFGKGKKSNRARVVRSRSLEENKGIKIQTQNTKQGVDCGLNEEGEQL